MDYFQEELKRITAKGLFRQTMQLESLGGICTINGKTFLNFSSNDYLNLASHPHVKAGAKSAIDMFGCGATASRLMAGTLRFHEELEARLARFVGKETSLLFGSGFLTNLGVICALASREDTVFEDKVNHASLIDAARLSGAALVRYRHCDMQDLEAKLRACRSKQKLIVSDSIFSMDGDCAPLTELSKLAKTYDAMLIVDEAHALGVYGGGLCQRGAIHADVILGTLSKALGGYGGFAATTHTLRQILVNKARPFIYSTGLPPGCLGSANAALDLLEQGSNLGDELLRNTKCFCTQIGVFPPFMSPIVPLIVKSNEASLALQNRLFDEGILVTAIRPPTVPVGTSRIRLSLTKAHDEKALEQLATLILKFGQEWPFLSH